MAEATGFEPAVACATAPFQGTTISLSDTLPFIYLFE